MISGIFLAVSVAAGAGEEEGASAIRTDETDLESTSWVRALSWTKWVKALLNLYAIGITITIRVWYERVGSVFEHFIAICEGITICIGKRRICAQLNFARIR